MKRFKITPTTLLLVLLLLGSVAAERWPMGDGATPYPLGNNYGEYQNYGGSPYYHDGIDVLGYGGEPNYSVIDGTLVLKQSSEPYYSGIMIIDDSGTNNGWVHWHITYSTIPFNVGDPVAVDDYIGDIATWPVADFHHDHFTRMYFTGGWYQAIDNPMEFMVPDTDPDAPVFRNARGTDIFAFRTNTQTSPTYLDPTALYGEVDVVALIGDLIQHPTWELALYTISWWVDGAGGSVPETLFVTFTGDIPPENTVPVIHSTDGTCYTRGDYDFRDFYYIVTNTDGDGVAEYSDHTFAWDTTLLPDGDYTFYVKAVDEYGNEVTESMAVTVDNSSSGVELLGFSAAGREEGLLLEWSTVGEASAFVLQRRESGDAAWLELHDSPITGRSWLDTAAVAGVEYEYRLSVVEAAGRREELGTLTARRDPELPGRFALGEPWPNPARGSLSFTVELPAAAIVEIELYDLGGRRVAARTISGAAGGNTLSLDADGLASGVYLLRVGAEGSSATRRVVISR